MVRAMRASGTRRHRHDRPAPAETVRGGGAVLDADQVLSRLVEGGDTLFRTLLPRFVAGDLAAVRTMALEELVQAVRDEAAGLDPQLIAEALGSADAGERIVGVAAARVNPDARLAGPLIAILRAPASGFEEYQVLKTLRDILDSFDEGQRIEVGEVLTQKLGDPGFLTSDRAVLGRATLGLIAPGM